MNLHVFTSIRLIKIVSKSTYHISFNIYHIVLNNTMTLGQGQRREKEMLKTMHHNAWADQNIKIDKFLLQIR